MADEFKALAREILRSTGGVAAARARPGGVGSARAGYSENVILEVLVTFVAVRGPNMNGL